MKTNSVARRILILFIVLLFCSLQSIPALSQDASSPGEKETAQSVEDSKPTSGPKTAKEKIGLYVYLAWVWLTIFVLIYFLRLKIIESDRLYDLEYFKDAGDNENSV